MAQASTQRSTAKQRPGAHRPSARGGMACENSERSVTLGSHRDEHNASDLSNDPESAVESAAETPKERPRSPWYCSLPWLVRGDLDGFTAVFSNNLATMLAGAQMLQSILPDELVYGKIVPGVGVSLAFGCAWYTVMALVKAHRTGRTDLCALPFGLNTPGVFAFNTGIIMAVYYAEGGAQNPDAPHVAWQVGVVANFVQGAIEMLLAPVGPYISSAVPMVALLGSLASVGLAWLFANTVEAEAAWPAVTFAPFFLIAAALLGGVKVPGLPSTLLPVVLGAALAWTTGRATASDLREAAELVGWHPGVPDFGPFQHFDKVVDYLGITIPVALTVAIGTIQVRQMAENVGDNYNLRWSMFGDGFGTVIASLFGSPWGMTVFIGHSAFKAMGAKIGYNILCAAGFLIVCSSGLAAMILAIFPSEVLNPIILFVGLCVCIDALEITPSRHWAGLLVALVPGFCNWACEAAASLAAHICEQGFTNGGSAVTGADVKCAVDPHSEAAWALGPELLGLKAMGEGYLLVSIFWGTLLVYAVDRHFRVAMVWSLIAAFCSSFGLIHAPKVFLPWKGPGSDTALHWEFAGGYAVCAILFAFLWMGQMWGLFEAGQDATQASKMMDQSSSEESEDQGRSHMSGNVS
uniref:SLC26A/SulP transporter domain-containing protein n=1 Tax=Zooxanthella nutricula TaxID=1333877 RepID=A0A7S2IZF4_9DINO